VNTSQKNIVLIHSLWMTPPSWGRWVRYYEAKGHFVFAWSWRGLERDIAELRDDPSSIAGLGITEIVDHYESLIRKLAFPPIIMGHSFGGPITQALLDRGLGSAGVAIAAVLVKGIIFLPLSTIRAVLPALSNPENNHRAVPLTPEQFHYAFANTLTETDYKEFPGRTHFILGQPGCWEEVAEYALVWSSGRFVIVKQPACFLKLWPASHAASERPHHMSANY
jgi:pimeloyl-ACP methyl ester carboxylesterase